MNSKPKFRVGQLVNNGGSYFKITEALYDATAKTWKYRDVWSWYFQASLRPLTKREKGGA